MTNFLFLGSEVLNSVEYYDPNVDEWFLISEMLTPRSGVQLITYENYLFVIGGNDGIIRQTSVERYDPNENEWEIITHMKTARSNFGCVVLEGIVYVIGGFNGNTTIPDVECFDPINDTWQDMWEMKWNRSALAVCVVSGLPNAIEYTWLKRELDYGQPSNYNERHSHNDRGNC